MGALAMKRAKLRESQFEKTKQTSKFATGIRWLPTQGRWQPTKRTKKKRQHKEAKKKLSNRNAQSKMMKAALSNSHRRETSQSSDLLADVQPTILLQEFVRIPIQVT